MHTIKSWKKIRKDVRNINLKEWKSTVYKCKDGFIPEVSFTKKDKKDGGLVGISYMSDHCTQGLLRKIASELPKNCIRSS